MFPGGIFTLEKLEGYVIGSGPAYLQLFDLAATASLSSGVTVPFRSMQLQGTDGFLWQYGDDNLVLPELQNGLVIAISSTDNVFTTYASTMNLVVSMVEWEMQYTPNPTNQALITVGDTTTAISSLSVWTNANATAGGTQQSRLAFVYVINAITAATQKLWLLLYATDTSPAVGTQAIGSFPIPPKVGTVNGQLSLNFGWNSSIIPTQYIPTDATANIQEAGTVKSGCFLQLSTTPGVYTTAAPQTVTIKAQYY